MYKKLAIAVMLVAFGFAARSTGLPSTPTSPIIITKRRLVNQTAPIPMTTIFTPAHDGVYRLSVYATITEADPTSQSSWAWTPGWTDDAGSEDCNTPFCYTGAGNSPGRFLAGLGIGTGIVMTVEAKAGTPITYTVSQIGNPDSSVYSLYYELEQIE